MMPNNIDPDSTPLPTNNSLDSTQGVDDFTQLATNTNIEISRCKQITDGEVILLDDQDSVLNVIALYFKLSCKASVVTINPVAIAKTLPESEQADRKTQTLNNIVEQITGIARDPDRRISLLFTDFNMKVFTGADLLSALKHTLGPDLPFAVIVNSGEPDLATNKESGIDFSADSMGFIEKPIQLSQLRPLVASFFNP